MDSMTTIIKGVRAVRLTALERKALLIRRAWTRAERRIVLHGFAGRLAIAVEPLLCATVFLALTLALVFNKNREIIILAPIFGLGVVAFAIYAICVMVAPVRALVHSFRPIFIVDGYIRYRGRDERSDDWSNGYLAVLTEDGRVACEWPTLGDGDIPAHQRPAMCEFSEYGGVHRIDGVSTGVLPDRIAALGVGGRSRKRVFEEF
jgi:hypothetical protein